MSNEKERIQNWMKEFGNEEISKLQKFLNFVIKYSIPNCPYTIYLNYELKQEKEGEKK